MWIVNLALRRPYTFIVLAIFILIAGVLSVLSTPKDIFPSINIPVISVIWTFTGQAPEEVEQHITSPYERVLTTTVDNIEHIESQSLNGIAVVKIFLQPNANVPAGIAQVTSVSQAVLKQLPNGITPPLVISYSATNVPVINVGLSSKTLSEQQLNDYGLNFVRTQLITVPGAAVPYPYGGKQRYVEVDLNYKALQGYGLTPSDVVNTINAQNLILPSGTQKIGRFEYQIAVNASPPTFEQLNAIPIKSLPNGTTIYMRDVARIVNGNIPQTNIVRFNGTRSTMLVVQKAGSASTRPTATFWFRSTKTTIQQINSSRLSEPACTMIFQTSVSGSRRLISLRKFLTSGCRPRSTFKLPVPTKQLTSRLPVSSWIRFATFPVRWIFGSRNRMMRLS